MYSSIVHSCTNNTVVAGYHDSTRNTDTPYRSPWRYICSSCAREGVFPGIPVCPVYRFFLVLPLQAGKSGHRLYLKNFKALLGKITTVKYQGIFVLKYILRNFILARFFGSTRFSVSGDRFEIEPVITPDTWYSCYGWLCYAACRCLKKNQNASSLDLLSIQKSGGKNVKTFRWDHRLKIQNLFMASKRVPLW